MAADGARRELPPFDSFNSRGELIDFLLDWYEGSKDRDMISNMMWPPLCRNDRLEDYFQQDVQMGWTKIEGYDLFKSISYIDGEWQYFVMRHDKALKDAGAAMDEESFIEFCKGLDAADEGPKRAYWLPQWDGNAYVMRYIREEFLRPRPSSPTGKEEEESRSEPETLPKE